MPTLVVSASRSPNDFLLNDERGNEIGPGFPNGNCFGRRFFLSWSMPKRLLPRLHLFSSPAPRPTTLHAHPRLFLSAFPVFQTPLPPHSRAHSASTTASTAHITRNQTQRQPRRPFSHFSAPARRRPRRPGEHGKVYRDGELDGVYDGT